MKSKNGFVAVILGVILAAVLLIGGVFLLFSSPSILDEFSLDKFTSYVDNLNCDTEYGKKDTSCNLAGKYEVVSEEGSGHDKVVHFRIKGTDLNFSVKVAVVDCFNIDGGSCFAGTEEWGLRDDYHAQATKYHFRQYNDSINYTYCREIEGSCINWYLEVVKTKQDLQDRMDYMHGFLDYLNRLDYKVLDKLCDFDLFFDKYYENGAQYSVSLYVELDDGKYVLRVPSGDADKYASEKDPVSAYITSFIYRKNIELE